MVKNKKSLYFDNVLMYNKSVLQNSIAKYRNFCNENTK